METQTERGVAALHDVRLAIYRQHTQLAQLLDELESHASGVIEGDDCAGSLNDALVWLHRRLVSHLEFEEARLAPLLKAVPEGRAAGLRASFDDHAEQRARIDGLLHDRKVFSDPRTLAREALAFVHTMRADMADEDAGLRSLG